MRNINLNQILTAAGILFLLYAVAGNYVALPGYVRFLERGSQSQSGAALDLSVIIGAAKTIVWMFSFQLGVLLLALAHARQYGLYAGWVGLIGIVWISLWAWPSLPRPGPWFYLTFGGAVLVAIALTVRSAKPARNDRLSRTLMLGAIGFFAFATWEICGLGSTGRMLHPEQAASPVAANLLVTQSSKLMIEFLIAWSLLLAAFALPRGSGPSRA
jgi:hypothetical protein